MVNYPQITFVANSAGSVDDDGSYELWRNLIIKGISKKINLDVEFGGMVKDPWGNEKAGFTLNGKVNRKELGLNWNAALEAGRAMLGADVFISCKIQLKRSE